jgi:hypothetical protein
VKYSDRQWYWIGGSGLAYHNRMRAVDFVRLFESEGLEVFFRRELVDAEAFKALCEGRVKPHARFAGYTHEELATDVIDIYARPLSMVRRDALGQHSGGPCRP